MFLFKKVISSLLLPPGLFIAILIISGVFFLNKKTWKAGLLNLIVGLLIWALSVAPVSGALLRGLEAGLTVPREPHADVIILLSGGTFDHAPTGDTMERIVTVATLYRALHVPVLVSGGPVFSHRAEAPIDARVLAGLGVPYEKILIEDRSRDTLENALYSKEICEKHHFKDPLVVTSAMHMRRALMCFDYAKMRVIAYPANFTNEKMVYGWKDYLPGELQISSKASHEYLGILYMKLLGLRRMGIFNAI